MNIKEGRLIFDRSVILHQQKKFCAFLPSRMIMEVMHGDTVSCVNHPFRNTNTTSGGSGGGICAFCLQEKLRNLISSSFPETVFPSSSPSSSPPSRSDVLPQSRTSGSYKDSSKRLPFSASHRHYKMTTMNKSGIKFSDSTGITKRRSGQVLDQHGNSSDSPHRRGFWSFLQYRRKKDVGDLNNLTPSTMKSGLKNPEGTVDEEENSGDDVALASPNPRISRSRSMGCGSKNISGDIFERLSMGFGDWSLRRVASQRQQGKQQQKWQNQIYKNGSTPTNNGLECISERVAHGGIFRGFIMTSSSSSFQGSRKSISSVAKTTSHSHTSHSRSKSWGWVLASPMRASAKPPSGNKESSPSSKSSTPSFSAVPSLLTVI